MPKSATKQPVRKLPRVLGSKGKTRAVPRPLKSEVTRLFGLRLSERMREENFTTAQLAVQLSVPSSTIRGWTTGKCMPSGDSLHRLGRALHIHPSVLFLGKSNGTSKT